MINFSENHQVLVDDMGLLLGSYGALELLKQCLIHLNHSPSELELIEIAQMKRNCPNMLGHLGSNEEEGDSESFRAEDIINVMKPYLKNQGYTLRRVK
jgi:hypothetical protein